MSKLKEEELLEWFKENIDRYVFLQISHPHLAYYPTERDKQAYQQIKEMIKDHAEQEEIEVRYIDIILDLYDRLEKKKPEVDKELIRKTARRIVEEVFKREYTTDNSQTQRIIKQMLKEAGIKVA